MSPSALAVGIVLVGTGFLGFALMPLHQVLTRLPAGAIHRRWLIMRALILMFIGAYLIYAVTLWRAVMAWQDFLIPGVLLCGGIFVWLTASLAVQTASSLRRVAVLEKETITDPLLGIYNRRFLERRLEEEFSRAQRYATVLSVMMIDIDHFKRVNDQLGHQVGDHVLSYLGKLLLQHLRASDMVARYGGEEIVIIAPNTGLQAARAQAERTRHQIEAHNLVVTDERQQTREVRITVSIGVATISPALEDYAQLLVHADQALYRAKQNGRNRVEVYPA